MMNRRDFIKGGVAAGLVWGAGGMLGGCSGLKRTDLHDPQAANLLPLLDGTAKQVLHYASLAPSGHNSQPWRVRVESRRTWIVEADRTRRLPAVDPDNRELLLSLGAFVENLAIAAGAVGLAADIQVLARGRQDRDVVRVALRKAQPTPSDLRNLEKRRTVKHGQFPQALAAGDVQTLVDRTDGNLVYFPRGSAHAACLRDAAVENYRIQTGRDDAQKELVRWLRLDDRAARAHRDGLTTEGMEITGISGWFLRSFGAPKDFLKPSYRKQGIDIIADLAAEGGGWFVLTSPGETVADLIAAGRRFQRLGLTARQLGIGIHPMTQMLEERQGLSQIGANHDGGFHPQFVLRAGYLNTYPEAVSLRRPVAWFTYEGRGIDG